MENYKKKYENALEIAKVINPGTKDYNIVTTIFPELKESEDEKIRKEIIDYLKSFIPHHDDDLVAKSKVWIAWLEKQGEKKLTLEDAAKAFLDALSNTPYNNTPITDAQVITRELLKFLSDGHSYNPNALNEQNSVWSEDDEKGLGDALWAIKQARTIAKDENDMGNLWYAENWLWSIKSKVQLKQEWSEKDEKYYGYAIWHINNSVHNGLSGDGSAIIDWLKSLKERCTWKPSDEQMKLLKEACDKHWEPDGLDPLYTLYEDLKKLKKE